VKKTAKILPPAPCHKCQKIPFNWAKAHRQYETEIRVILGRRRDTNTYEGQRIVDRIISEGKTHFISTLLTADEKREILELIQQKSFT
jgi:hypothetical protein